MRKILLEVVTSTHGAPADLLKRDGNIVVSARATIFESKPRLKRTLFLISWVLSFVILIIIARNNEFNRLYNNAFEHSFDFRLPKNQIGALSYTRFDPTGNRRPIYFVRFKNLSAENNKLGIFNTGLHKVVKIQDLELRFYRYNSSKVTSTSRLNNDKSPKITAGGLSKPCTATITDIFSIPKDTTSNARTLFEIIDRLVHPKDGWHVNIDLSKVSEVHVNHFAYKEFYDGNLFFGVQSKRAIAFAEQSGLLLRGHVTITTAGGSTLESNRVKWDITKQHFKVKGIYALNRDGKRTTGNGICVDTQLNVVTKQHAKVERKERERCLVKL